MNFPKPICPIVAIFSLLIPSTLTAAEKMKALILDGQNNHDVWPKSTLMMRQYLQETGMFEVDIARSASVWRWQKQEKYLALAGVGESEKSKKSKPDPNFSPDFSKYDVIINNFGYNAAPWPEKTKKAFESYMANGGGLVIVHAASNSWGKWAEYNKMIGLGGWGGRNVESGPYVYYNREGQVVRDSSPGKCGAHGPKHEFVVRMRNTEHPITKGLPEFWMHAKDECYSMLRGPAENMTILATAADTPKLQQEGRNEPALMVIDYHKGRVFHTILGDNVPGFESVGFIVTFKRGAEWAATGKVTQKVPTDFPTKEKSSSRPFELKDQKVK